MKKEKNLPNIIFIIADTLRAKNVGIYGRFPSPTPNIDKLGREGIVFTNAYATITKSDPSTVAIMSGKYPLSCGLIGHGRWLEKKQIENLKKTIFLPEILQKKGYTTIAVDWLSRWHRRGYDYYSGKILKDVDEKELIKETILFLKYWRWLDLITIKLIKRDFFVRFYYCFFSKVRYTYDPADVVVDEALKFLNKIKKRPFFMYLRFRDPHFPHTRPRGLKSYLFDSLEKRYEAEINFMDEQIGKLLDFLRKEKIEDNLVVFTSDHGESLYEHGVSLAHRGLYENIVRVPLIINYPKLSPKRLSNLVQHVDILPTILDLIKVRYPPGIDGESLMPYILGIKKKGKSFVFFEDISFGEMKIKKSTRRRGLREGRYKYIETLRGLDKDLFSVIPKGKIKIVKQELYDLQRDCAEEKNLVKDKPLLVKKLQMKLKKTFLKLERRHWGRKKN